MISRRVVVGSVLVLLPLALVFPMLRARSWQPRRVAFPATRPTTDNPSDLKWLRAGLSISFFAPQFAAGKNRSLQIRNWNGETLPVRTTPRAWNWNQASPVWSPDGSSVLAPVEAEARTFPVGIYNASTGKIARILREKWTPPKVGSFATVAGIWSLAWSPNSRLVAANSIHLVFKPKGSSGGGVVWWDARSGRQIGRGRGTAGSIHALAFSPDSQILAGAGRDGNVYGWNVSDGKLMFTLPGHGGSVRALAWSPDARHLAVGAGTTSISGGFGPVLPLNPSRVWIWNLKRRSALTTTSNDALSSGHVAFSPDGKTLAAHLSTESVYLLDAFTGQNRRHLPSPTRHLRTQSVEIVNGLAFSPNGDTLAVSTSRDLTLWRIQ